MRSRYEIRVLNGGLVLILYVLIGIYSCVHAQAIQRIHEGGFEATYGFHNFRQRTIGENTTKLSPCARGLSLGGYFGNNLLKIRVRGVGYYQANKLFDEHYNQYEAEVISSFSPLEFFRVSRNVVDIYFITGLNYTLINLDNHSYDYEEKQFDRISRVAGMGFEYIVRKGHKTICIFSDATVANHLRRSKEKNSNTPFPSIQSALNFGVRIGYKRHIKLKPGF